MTSSSTLFLHEEILLLALRDAEGSPEFGTWYQQAIGGAILAELLLLDRIRVDDSKKKLVHARNPKPVGDPVIDECLARIRKESKPRWAQDWVSRFAAMSDLKNRVAEGLCRRGILKADEAKVLLIFSRKIFPEIDPRPEREIKERLRSAIFDESAALDARTMVLVSLADTTGILRATFDKKGLAEKKKRLEQIKNGGVAGKAAGGAIEAVEAAQAAQAAVVAGMMVAVTIPTIIHS